jgi:hypothetical protein
MSKKRSSLVIEYQRIKTENLKNKKALFCKSCQKSFDSKISLKNHEDSKAHLIKLADVSWAFVDKKSTVKYSINKISSAKKSQDTSRNEENSLKSLIVESLSCKICEKSWFGTKPSLILHEQSKAHLGKLSQNLQTANNPIFVEDEFCVEENDNPKTFHPMIDSMAEFHDKVNLLMDQPRTRRSIRVQNLNSSYCEIIGVESKQESNQNLNSNDSEEISLPYGWKKHVHIKKETLVSPYGETLMSTVELERYLAMNPNIKCDLKVTNIYCEVENQDTNSKTPIHKNSEDNVTKNLYMCRICDNQFATIDELTNHISKIHEEKKPQNDSTKKLYMCTICEDHFAQLEELTNHISAVHEEKKPQNDLMENVYLCKICQEPFAKIEELTKHYSLVHEEKKPLKDQAKKMYLCTICQEQFAYIEELTEHFSSVHEEKKQSQSNNDKNITPTLQKSTKISDQERTSEFSFSKLIELKEQYTSVHEENKPSQSSNEDKDPIVDAKSTKPSGQDGSPEVRRSSRFYSPVHEAKKPSKLTHQYSSVHEEKASSQDREKNREVRRSSRLPVKGPKLIDTPQNNHSQIRKSGRLATQESVKKPIINATNTRKTGRLSQESVEKSINQNYDKKHRKSGHLAAQVPAEKPSSKRLSSIHEGKKRKPEVGSGKPTRKSRRFTL